MDLMPAAQTICWSNFVDIVILFLMLEIIYCRSRKVVGVDCIRKSS